MAGNPEFSLPRQLAEEIKIKKLADKISELRSDRDPRTLRAYITLRRLRAYITLLRLVRRKYLLSKHYKVLYYKDPPG